MYLAQVLGLFLTGVGDARATFQVQISGAGSSLVLGLPLACVWGATGACAGMAAVNATKAVAGAILASSKMNIWTHRYDEAELGLPACQDAAGTPGE
jgi:Na+-driven multidrug efflux pump